MKTFLYIRFEKALSILIEYYQNKEYTRIIINEIVHCYMHDLLELYHILELIIKILE